MPQLCTSARAYWLALAASRWACCASATAVTGSLAARLSASARCRCASDSEVRGAGVDRAAPGGDEVGGGGHLGPRHRQRLGQQAAGPGGAFGGVAGLGQRLVQRRVGGLQPGGDGDRVRLGRGQLGAGPARAPARRRSRPPPARPGRCRRRPGRPGRRRARPRPRCTSASADRRAASRSVTARWIAAISCSAWSTACSAARTASAASARSPPGAPAGSPRDRPAAGAAGRRERRAQVGDGRGFARPGPPARAARARSVAAAANAKALAGLVHVGGDGGDRRARRTGNRGPARPRPRAGSAASSAARRWSTSSATSRRPALQVAQPVEVLGLGVQPCVRRLAQRDDLRQRLPPGGQIGCRLLLQRHPQPERLGDVLPGRLQRRAGTARWPPRRTARSASRQFALAGAQVVVQLDEQGVRLGGQVLDRRAGVGRGGRGGAAARRRRTTSQISAPAITTTKTIEHPDQPGPAGRGGAAARYPSAAATTAPAQSPRLRAGSMSFAATSASSASESAGVVGERIGVRAVGGGHGEQGVPVAQVAESRPSRRSTAGPACRRTTRRTPRTAGCPCRPAAGPAPRRPRPGRRSARRPGR